MIDIPISEKYCLRLYENGSILLTYIGTLNIEIRGLGFIIPANDIQPMIDALVRAQKLLVLK
jgi:hypothetical protein